MEALRIPTEEIALSAIRAQGAGGQNVNKVSSAIHLRFDIAASSLPDGVKARLLALRDSRITQDGVLVIKAQQHRTQESNKFDAMVRLNELVNSVAHPPKARKATQPTKASRRRLREDKARRSGLKAQRIKVQQDG
ncbi:alternative ribosome rescue aminoacyl-tRNA hydrolase ArfB [Rhodoferax sp.]|uniref:alternative ribosome rescue aminoacyl-tRNA hydrolase ArfB n=1 Tax=Rhodoferax sp. TaxID=50421 RepID=UPI00284098DD|nr:alternative ribosome rescue aminoacyl-tRNA hydrolase ArfB [Rhodoferax sp.]MDR3369643.1 alternative ribosome rescue aminoacyl-tRNA hydrolase ArfB [Rhodoferax sp.]